MWKKRGAGGHREQREYAVVRTVAGEAGPPVALRPSGPLRRANRRCDPRDALNVLQVLLEKRFHVRNLPDRDLLVEDSRCAVRNFRDSTIPFPSCTVMV